MGKPLELLGEQEGGGHKEGLGRRRKGVRPTPTGGQRRTLKTFTSPSSRRPGPPTRAKTRKPEFTLFAGLSPTKHQAKAFCHYSQGEPALTAAPAPLRPKGVTSSRSTPSPVCSIFSRTKSAFLSPWRPAGLGGISLGLRDCTSTLQLFLIPNNIFHETLGSRQCWCGAPCCLPPPPGDGHATPPAVFVHHCGQQSYL